MTFEYFWHTKDNIPEGLGFEFLGARHIITWLIALAIIILVAAMFKKADPASREFTLRGMAFSMAALEIIKDIAAVIVGQWSTDYLPLHICGISIILAVIWILTRNSVVADLLYSIGIFGAALALTTPNWMSLPVLNFMHLQSVVIHILLVLFPIMIVIQGHRPNIKNWPKCFLAAVCYCVPVYILNKILDTDFVFLNGARDTPFVPLVNAIGPLYVIPMLAVLGLIMLLMYLPWYLADRKREKTAEKAKS